MFAHEPTIIPLDIILHIVKHAASSEVALLLQLNRVCYHTILSTLYKSVSLRTLGSLMAFGHTILNGEHLRDHVYTLDIQLDPNQDIDCDFPCLLRPMLELVPNLTDLTLAIPPRMAFCVFMFRNFPYPFKLKRLFVSPTRDIVGMNRFLRFQHRIEIFGLAYESWSSQFRISDLMPGSNFHNSDLLPYLQQAVVPWPLLPGLMPRRPVTNVDISSLPLEPENMIGLEQLLWEAIVPLEHLKLGLVVPSTGPIEAALNHIISIISPCRRSLKGLSIRLWNQVPLQEIQPWRAERKDVRDVYMALLRMHIFRFTRLERFQVEIEGAQPLPLYPLGKQTELMASYSSAWKQMCPNLKFFSLFGSVLYIETDGL